MREYGSVHTVYKAGQKLPDFYYEFNEPFQYKNCFSSVLRSSKHFVFQVSLKVIKIGQNFNKLRKGSKIQIALLNGL